MPFPTLRLMSFQSAHKINWVEMACCFGRLLRFHLWQTYQRLGLSHVSGLVQIWVDDLAHASGTCGRCTLYGMIEACLSNRQLTSAGLMGCSGLVLSCSGYSTKLRACRIVINQFLHSPKPRQPTNCISRRKLGGRRS